MTLWTRPQDGETPLTPEGREGLIPAHITLRQELNELEQANIMLASVWVFQRNRNILNQVFLKRLHKKMFSDVWKWAGSYRKIELNIGVKYWKIEVELEQVLRDVECWIENKSYVPDEIAVRFHHRLVLIHPFPNGNGRWARLIADVLIVSLGGQRFSWGGGDLRSAEETRKRYIAALKKADKHDLTDLVLFARA